MVLMPIDRRMHIHAASTGIEAISKDAAAVVADGPMHFDHRSQRA